MIDNPEQRSLDWFRKRLGNFTGSRVGDLMTKGKKKDEPFSQTALGYIAEVAAERLLSDDVVNDDDLMQEYIYQTSFVTNAMRWGIEQEESARELYQQQTGRHIIEVSSCAHKEIANFASSPDGFFYDENVPEKGCLEIKCPNLKTFVNYVANIKDNESLALVEPKYYWQCMAHMACVGADWCDFIAYNPFAKHPLHIVRINRAEDAIRELEGRVILADLRADTIIEKYNSNVNANGNIDREHMSE
jgi:hypothetical protein